MGVLVRVALEMIPTSADMYDSVTPKGTAEHMSGDASRQMQYRSASLTGQPSQQPYRCSVHNLGPWTGLVLRWTWVRAQKGINIRPLDLIVGPRSEAHIGPHNMGPYISSPLIRAQLLGSESRSVGGENRLLEEQNGCDFWMSLDIH